MLNMSQLSELCNKIKQHLPKHLEVLQQDLSKNGRLILQKILSSCKLVSREEFDVQTKVLERTRDKLQDLEHLVHKVNNPEQDNASASNSAKSSNDANQDKV